MRRRRSPDSWVAGSVNFSSGASSVGAALCGLDSPPEQAASKAAADTPCRKVRRVMGSGRLRRLMTFPFALGIRELSPGVHPRRDAAVSESPRGSNSGYFVVLVPLVGIPRLELSLIHISEPTRLRR